MKKIETNTNRFGEIITIWESHIHPDNTDFMQVVRYMHIQYPDGRNNLHWRLCNSSANDKHIIYNISLDEAKSRFLEKEDAEITEEMFQEWLKDRKNVEIWK